MPDIVHQATGTERNTSLLLWGLSYLARSWSTPLNFAVTVDYRVFLFLRFFDYFYPLCILDFPKQSFLDIGCALQLFEV